MWDGVTTKRHAVDPVFMLNSFKPSSASTDRQALVRASAISFGGSAFALLFARISLSKVCGRVSLT